MVASLQALPPSLGSCLGLHVVNLLQLLEVLTGVGFCRFCCNPEPHCRCAGVSQSAPMSWSQIAEQTPGYGVTASSSGVTTPEYLLGRYVQIRGTSTRALHLEHASFGGLSTKGARCIPMIQTSHWEGHTAKATLSWQALAPQAPQMAPPICQPLPFPRGQPATLYQQAVQPPGKSSGLGVTFDSSATKPAPTGGQDADVCGRQGT